MQTAQNYFKLHSEYAPTGDQPQAIETLVNGFREGNQFQTLLVQHCINNSELNS